MHDSQESLSILEAENTPEVENHYGTSLLFNDDDESNRNDSLNWTNVRIDGIPSEFVIEYPPDVGTLFAHQIWSGSKFLSLHLAKNPQFVQNKCTLELGAGTALPSLSSLYLGSRVSIITDYPDDRIVNSIRRTVERNAEACRSDHRVDVIGYEWGTDVTSIRRATSSLFSLQSEKEKLAENNDAAVPTPNNFSFDVILLSECLWIHRTHAALAESIHKLLNPTTGIVLLTYAHHVPGMEEKDDSFFDIMKEKYGLITTHVETRSMQYMWDEKKKESSFSSIPGT